jgi:hypothetical protein
MRAMALFEAHLPFLPTEALLYKKSTMLRLKCFGRCSIFGPHTTVEWNKGTMGERVYWREP